MIDWLSIATLLSFFGMGILGIRLASTKYRLAIMFLLVALEVAALRYPQVYFSAQMYVVLQRNFRQLLLWDFPDMQWLGGIVFLALIITMTFKFGNIFCGWICPTPALHEIVYLRKWAPRIPTQVDKLMKKTRYAVLVAFLLVLFIWNESIFSLFFRIGNNMGLKIFLIGFLVLSLFIFRAFCRWFCPMGLLLNGLAKLGRKTATFTSECNGCKIAQRQCNMSAITCPSLRQGHPGSFARSDCIDCGLCAKACPKDAIKF